jgi:hypothetical protein
MEETDTSCLCTLYNRIARGKAHDILPENKIGLTPSEINKIVDDTY